MADMNGWLFALGGTVAGFVMAKVFGQRDMHGNPSGLHMDLGGVDVYGRVAGLPHGTVEFYTQRPNSKVEDMIGRVSQTAGDLYRAYPPAAYKKLGVTSTVRREMLADGVIKRTLRQSAQYLLDVYMAHYQMSKAHAGVEKRRMGEEFDALMGSR